MEKVYAVDSAVHIDSGPLNDIICLSLPDTQCRSPNLATRKFQTHHHRHRHSGRLWLLSLFDTSIELFSGEWFRTVSSVSYGCFPSKVLTTARFSMVSDCNIRSNSISRYPFSSNNSIGPEALNRTPHPSRLTLQGRLYLAGWKRGTTDAQLRSNVLKGKIKTLSMVHDGVYQLTLTPLPKITMITSGCGCSNWLLSEQKYISGWRPQERT